MTNLYDQIVLQEALMSDHLVETFNLKALSGSHFKKLIFGYFFHSIIMPNDAVVPFLLIVCNDIAVPADSRILTQYY